MREEGRVLVDPGTAGGGTGAPVDEQPEAGPGLDREGKPGEPRAAGWAPALLAFLPPFLVGAALRLWNLPAQVMSDDEFHAVRAALNQPVRTILTTYYLVDNSIPLSALFRLLFDSGLRLSETAFRVPSLLCGLAVLGLFPLWADRRLGRSTAIAFAWLLALSPALVWYSRIARSYMPIILLGGVAAAAFESWWRRPRLGMGVAYVLSAALATWFHLVAGTFVAAAPFLFAAGDLLVRRELSRDRRRLVALVLLGVATAGAFLAFLVPAGESLLAMIHDKRASGFHFSAPLFADVAELLAGTGRLPVAVLFWLAAAAGLVSLARSPRRSPPSGDSRLTRPDGDGRLSRPDVDSRLISQDGERRLTIRDGDHRLAPYTSALAFVHLAGIVVLAPVGHQYPVILNRYLVIALPVVLLWVAAALGRLLAGPSGSPSGRQAWRLSSLAPAPRIALAAVFLALLAAAGPFADPSLRASPLAHHDDYMAFYAPRSHPERERVPGFYRWLASSSEPGAVLEYPWMPMWRVNRAFYLYQEVHGREVVVAPPRPLLWDERLALRNMAPGDPRGLLASRARYLVVHRDLGREEDAIPDVFQPARPGILPRFEFVFRRFGRGMGDRLAVEWGPPDHADRRLRVWDLDRVRRERAARRTAL